MAQAFNDLQRRLALAWQQERSFVDGVAHELRTPISVISVTCSSGRGSRASHQLPLLAAEVDRMTQLLQVMLELARGDAGRLQLDRHSLDPEECCCLPLSGCNRWPRPGCSSIPAAQPLPGSGWTRSDPAMPCGTGAQRTGLQPGAGEAGGELDANAVVLHVVDQGPGIPAEEPSG